MATHDFIRTQGVGDNFQGVYYVESFFHRLTVTGKDFTDMILRDKSGSRNVKAWSKVNGVGKGDFVFISATVEDYNGSPSIIAKNVELEDPPEDLDNYISVYEDSEKMSEGFDTLREELKACCGKTDDETADMLIEEIFRPSSFFTQFISSPGNTMPYYGRRGGLLANTVRVGISSWKSSDDLNDTEKAVLLASSLIFRIGTVDAFAFEHCLPAETKNGILLGVNNLTMFRMSMALKRVASTAKQADKEVSEDVLTKIMHCISSYDGVVKPMTKEAIILSSAYSADREIVGAMDFIANDQNEGEEFTAWDSVAKRRYFRG